MYKAIDTTSGQEIIILHPAWRDRMVELRQMDHVDRLVCQGCGQPLRVKAGEVKRPHFAHKHLMACSLGSETPEILLARAILYEFLLEYFGDEVGLEQQVDGADLPRPVDCWVQTPSGALAYWLVETGIKVEPREAILKGLSQQGIHPGWIMLAGMLREEKKLFDSLLLSPTERAFVQVTPFDQALAGLGTPGPSLHYLDFTQGTLITYRNLALHHKPNWFKGLKRSHPLAQILVDRQTGNLIHPGEEQLLQTFTRKQKRLSEKRRRLIQADPDWQAPKEQPADGEITTGWGMAPRPANERMDPSATEALECAQCGQVTQDYWMVFFQGERKMCRCRNCLGAVP